MLFQSFQRFAIVVVLVEILRTLHGSGVFQPIEDYLEDLRRRVTEGLFLTSIKMGGAVSLMLLVWRILAMIHPICYLIFFTGLYTIYANQIYFEGEGVLLDKDEILKEILQNEWDVVDIPEVLGGDGVLLDKDEILEEILQNEWDVVDIPEGLS